MHELGIARDLWAIVKQHAAQNGLKKINRISIAVGEASGIETDFLRHSLVDHILPGTFAEGAELVITVEKLSARCNGCRKEISTENITSVSCPFCGGINITLISGKETYVQSIEGT